MLALRYPEDMTRGWLGMGMLASLAAGLACGTDSSTSAGDGGADAVADVAPRKCNADFPCRGTYECSSATSYYPAETRDCHSVCGPGPCGGETCAQTGPSVECPDAMLCVSSHPSAASPACAPLGDPGCFPGDGGAVDAAGPYASPAQSACAPQDITDFVASCLLTSNASKCSTFTSAHKACTSCLVGSRMGPIALETSGPGANVAGCLALATGDASPASCAAQRAATDACARGACSECGPLAPANVDPSAAIAACEANARTTSCSALAGAECDSVDAGAASVCYAGSLAEFVTQAGPLFCSSGG